MELQKICKKIAINKLGKSGTVVECMVKSIFPEHCGSVGKTYEVKGFDSCGLRLKDICALNVIATRFRIVSEEK